MAKRKGNPKAAAAMRLARREGISLKAAWARVKGGRGASKGKKSNPGPGGGRRAPGLGATYEGFMKGAELLAPVSDEVLLRTTTGASLTAGLGSKLQGKVMSAGYGSNAVVSILDGAISAKTRQAQAISRGSVTAILPEAYLGLLALDTARATGGSLQNRALVIQRRLLKARQGYDVATNKSSFGDEFWTYRGLKHGGQGVRWAARTRIGQRIVRPVRPLLKAIGAGV